MQCNQLCRPFFLDAVRQGNRSLWPFQGKSRCFLFAVGALPTEREDTFPQSQPELSVVFDCVLILSWLIWSASRFLVRLQMKFSDCSISSTVRCFHLRKAPSFLRY